MTEITVAQAVQLALQFQQAGRLQEAEALYRAVLQREPNNADVLHLLGVLAHQAGKPQIAIDLISQAIRIAPTVPWFHNNLGEVYRTAGLLDQAVACYQQAIALSPGYAEPHMNLGNALLQMGRPAEAISPLQKSVELKPELPMAFNSLGVALQQAGRVDEAVAAFRKALALQPDFFDAQLSLGNLLLAKGFTDEAVEAIRRATQINPAHPGAWVNLEAALQAKGLLDEAIAASRKAIELQPNFAPAHYNLGTALQKKGLFDEALAAYDKAIELQPEFAEAHMNKAWVLLIKGDCERGWPEYEWRAKCRDFLAAQRNFSQPMWKGSDPAGKTILIHAEQGLGDTIQFVRYAPLLARRGARVIVECQPELKPLLQDLEGVECVISTGEPLPAFDMHVPMLSLPLAFGTTLQTVPAVSPYLKPDPERVKAWRAKLRGRRPQLRVGLAWAGNPMNPADRDRSLPLSALAPLAEVKGVTFHSLQKGERAAQAKTPPPGMKLTDLTDDIKDFADTAALMAHLDLIITVETAVAHLAGALAKPVWTLLPFMPAWRWLLERNDSPWYPTMRLFRQPSPGDWDSVVQRVAEELRRRCAEKAK